MELAVRPRAPLARFFVYVESRALRFVAALVSIASLHFLHLGECATLFPFLVRGAQLGTNRMLLSPAAGSPDWLCLGPNAAGYH